MSSRASIASSRTAATATTNMPFKPQTQEAPLNEKALNELDAIRRLGLRRNEVASRDVTLDACLKKAAEYLEKIVGDINDRAHEERTRKNNRLQKKQQDGEEGIEEDREEFENYQQKVKDLTDKMDEGIRRVIDAQNWSKQIPASLQHVITKSKDVQNQRRTTSRARSNDDSDEAEDAEDQTTLGHLDSSEHASALFNAAQSTAEAQWTAQTLTQRYAQNPTYTSFYKVKFDSDNQGENPPPVPHHSMWFAVQEGRTIERNTQRGTQKANADEDESDEDTELQIASENVSCKCPLTLQYFIEPVTSTKCPHSFEKKDMLSFIRSNNGVVVCPVPGCGKMISESDLISDTVLLRKTLRAKEIERRDQEADDIDEEDEDSDDVLLGTQRRRRSIVHLGSSPATRRKTWVKPERTASVIPNSQPAASGRSRGRQHEVTSPAENDENEDEDMDDD